MDTEKYVEREKREKIKLNRDWKKCTDVEKMKKK